MSIISEIGGTRTRLQRNSGLACLEIRSRNEEAINSTRNIFYSLRVSYFLLYRRRYFLFLNWFSTRVSDDQKYVCGSSLYACISTRKFKGLDSREITSLPDIEKVIYMARHFNRRKNSMLITRLITVKVCNTRPSLYDAKILSPNFHGLRKERLAEWPAFCVPRIREGGGGEGTSRKIGRGGAARFLKPLPYFRPKSAIFPTLFQTWSKIWYPISDLKPWSPARDQSAWQTVTARTR